MWENDYYFSIFFFSLMDNKRIQYIQNKSHDVQDYGMFEKIKCNVRTMRMSHKSHSCYKGHSQQQYQLGSCARYIYNQSTQLNL